LCKRILDVFRQHSFSPQEWVSSFMTRRKTVNSEELALAATALKQGYLVAFPTETVYGLGADAENLDAVSRIFSVKGRPQDHPLIVHVSSREHITKWAENIPDFASKLAQDYWPGPMTLILKRSELARDEITGGQDTVGLRVPNNQTALALLSEFERLGGKGVAAPSANRFGKVSPTTAEAVNQELSGYLSEQDLILDSGPCQVGIESTIIDCTGDQPIILRPGAITPAMVEESTRLRVGQTHSRIRVSGSLESHYSPRAAVVLNTEPHRGEGLIAMSTVPTPEGVVRLATPASAEEYAQLLYSALRQADEMALTKVVAITPDGDDIALAITDRLQRASVSIKNED
jgi:L-threonylcarbamoyladenylate synthase